MRASIRSDRGFWARVCLTGFVVNVPIAMTVVVGGLHIGIAAVLSVVSGIVLVAAWDSLSARGRVVALPGGGRAELEEGDDLVLARRRVG